MLHALSVQLGQNRGFYRRVILIRRCVSRCTMRIGGSENLDVCILVGILLNWSVELAVLVVRSTEWQKRKQLLREWRDVSAVAFTSFTCVTVL